MIREFLFVSLGGAFGAVTRHLVSHTLDRLWGHPFPVAILIVNVVGCGVLGFLGTWFAHAHPWSPDTQKMITVGFLGSLTTFSTFAFDAVRLWNHTPQHAWLNVVANLLLGVGAVVLGSRLAYAWFSG